MLGLIFVSLKGLFAVLFTAIISELVTAIKVATARAPAIVAQVMACHAV